MQKEQVEKIRGLLKPILEITWQGQPFHTDRGYWFGIDADDRELILTNTTKALSLLPKPCETCRGRKRIICPRCRDLQSTIERQHFPCPRCKATGFIPCPDCQEPNVLDYPVPKGFLLIKSDSFMSEVYDDYIKWLEEKGDEAEVRHPTDMEGKVNHKRNYCYKCGTTVRDQKFCHNCGRKLKWPACCKPKWISTTEALFGKPCKICGGSRKKIVIKHQVPCEVPCPDCQAPAGEVEEFVKKLRDEAGILQLYDKPESRRGAFLYSDIYKVCTHLTTLLKQIAQFKEGAFVACEEAQIRDDQIKQFEVVNTQLEKQLGLCQNRFEAENILKENKRLKKAIGIARDYVAGEYPSRTYVGKLYDIDQALQKGEAKE